MVPLSPPFCARDDARFCRDAVCGARGYWCGGWVGLPMAAPRCRGISRTSRPRARFRDTHCYHLPDLCLCGDAFWYGIYWQYIANPDAVSGIDVSRIPSFGRSVHFHRCRAQPSHPARYPGRWPAHTRQYHRCWSGCAHCGFWAVAAFGYGDRNFYFGYLLRCCRVSHFRSASKIPGVLRSLCRVSSHPDSFSLWPNGEYVLHFCCAAFWLSRYMENRRYARRAHGDDYLFGRGLFWRAGCVPDAHGWFFDGVQ